MYTFTNEATQVATLSHFRLDPISNTRKLVTNSIDSILIKFISCNNLMGTIQIAVRNFVKWFLKELLLMLVFYISLDILTNGNVNRHYYRYWRDSNPRSMREQQTQYPEKMNILAGILGNKIVSSTDNWWVNFLWRLSLLPHCGESLKKTIRSKKCMYFSRACRSHTMHLPYVSF